MKAERPLWVELPILLLVALAVAVIIKTFLVQPFYVPSESMLPTIEVNDRVMISKLNYQFADPQRGDIVVFRLPKDDSTDYIKRVIGLPGDRIQMREGLLHINDKPIKRERLSDFIGEDPCGSDATARVKRWKEVRRFGLGEYCLHCSGAPAAAGRSR